MVKKRRKQIFVWGFLLVVFLLIAFGLAVFFAPEPPQGELKLARESLVEAQQKGAEQYAKKLYQEAHQSYDSAMIYWAVENERFVLFRNYDSISRLANKTIELAVRAGDKSIQLEKDDNKLVRKGLSELDKKVRFFEEVYKAMPLSEQIFDAHNKGKMKLSEARIAFEDKRFGEAKVHYQQALGLINSSNEKADKVLKAWFAHFQQWKKYDDEAYRLSKSGQKVILVDKYAHECLVLQKGKVLRQFHAELGPNWIGDKRRKGDKATPEGIYRITKKKEGSFTRFHRALLINYPNDDDRQRFTAEKEKGTLPKQADIGGLIELHGHGGKGVDWTDGCVAFSNSDMDVLFQLVGVGTPVIIIGSQKSLDEIYAAARN